MNNTIDPRTKLFLVLCISTIGLISRDVLILFSITIVGIIISKIFGGNFFVLIKKIKKLLYVFFFIIIIQSIFTRQGNPVIVIGGFEIVTDLGLNRALGYMFRVLIIIISGVIISTSSERNTIQGIVQLGLPYEFAFMTAVGIKFLPLLIEEFKDTYMAIQLRGINIMKLPIWERFKITSYIFIPVVASALNKAKKLSISVESRAFRAYDRRTSITSLKLKYKDYLIILISLTTAFALIYLKWI